MELWAIQVNCCITTVIFRLSRELLIIDSARSAFLGGNADNLPRARMPRGVFALERAHLRRALIARRLNQDFVCAGLAVSASVCRDLQTSCLETGDYWQPERDYKSESEVQILVNLFPEMLKSKVKLSLKERVKFATGELVSELVPGTVSSLSRLMLCAPMGRAGRTV